MLRLFAIATLGALLAACPGPSSLDGGSRQDGGPEACRPVTSPPQLVSNPSFECGTDTGATSWFARSGELSIVSDAHTGARAVKMTVGSDGLQAVLAYELDVDTELGSKTYCATVWAKGMTKSDLVLRRFPGTDARFVGVPSATWKRIPPNLVLDATGDGAQRLLLFVTTLDAKPGDSLLIDDVDVWVSSSGRCDENRGN